MCDFENYLNEQLKDDEFRKEYERLLQEEELNFNDNTRILKLDFEEK